MSTLGVLLRNEWIKASSFRSFRVTILLYSGLMGVIFYVRHSMAGVENARRPVTFALPEAWDFILTGHGPFTLFFVLTAVILIVVHEFTSRTSRQNVIDGLSKAQFFTAKALLVPIVALLFCALLVVFGGGFALLGPDDAQGLPLLRGSDLGLMGRFVIGMAGFGALAFLSAVSVRSGGAAMGLVFLYFLVVEQFAITTVSLYYASQDVLWPAYAARWSPGAAFSRLIGQPLAGQRALQALLTRLEGSEPPGDAAMVLAGVAWITVVIAVTYAIYRKRDL